MNCLDIQCGHRAVDDNTKKGEGILLESTNLFAVGPPNFSGTRKFFFCMFPGVPFLLCQRKTFTGRKDAEGPTAVVLRGWMAGRKGEVSGRLGERPDEVTLRRSTGDGRVEGGVKTTWGPSFGPSSARLTYASINHDPGKLQRAFWVFWTSESRQVFLSLHVNEVHTDRLDILVQKPNCHLFAVSLVLSTGERNGWAAEFLHIPSLLPSWGVCCASPVSQSESSLRFVLVYSQGLCQVEFLA